MRILSIASVFFFMTVVVYGGVVRSAGVDAGRAPFTCPDGSMGDIQTSFEYEGKLLTMGTCHNSTISTGARDIRGVKGRSTQTLDVCNEGCTTYCIGGTGGPNPNDCTSLVEGYGNGNDGTGFTIYANTVIYWTYGSCQVYMGAPENYNVYECYNWSKFAGIVNYIAWNCQSEENARGGFCNWAVQYAEGPFQMIQVVVDTA